MSNAYRVYSATYCGYCRAAIRLLKGRQAAVEVIDVTTDWDMRAELKRLTGRHTVPQVFHGETHVGGFEDLIRYLENQPTG